MKLEELKLLLNQPEGTNLEFKSKLHELYHADGAVKKLQRDEFIRDVISLANNNTATAGESAYLVFGVEESKDLDTPHRVVGLDGRLPSRAEILDLVNPACDPPIGDITCEEFLIDNHKVLVVTIPPDPHLHETTRKLQTGERSYYSEHVVFIRHNQSIQIASAKERAALQEIRRARMTDRRTVKPELASAIFAGAVGGSLSIRISETILPNSKYAKGIIGIFSTILFGAFGWMSGGWFTEFGEIRAEWKNYSAMKKSLSVFYLALMPISIVLMYIGQWKPQKKESVKK